MSIKVTGIKFPLDNRSRSRDMRKNNSLFSILKMLRAAVSYLDIVGDIKIPIKGELRYPDVVTQRCDIYKFLP